MRFNKEVSGQKKDEIHTVDPLAALLCNLNIFILLPIPYDQSGR
jgi:hypothetical protein